jgi:hypothetical protein
MVRRPRAEDGARAVRFCSVAAMLPASRSTSVGCCCARRSNVARSMRTSSLERSARTLAERLAPVSRPSSPTLSPGAISPSTVPASSGAASPARTETCSRPRTRK